MICLMLAAHFKLLLMCVPRNLKELVRVIGLPFISMGVLRKVNNEFLGLGSSWVWAVLSWSSLFEHQFTAWSNTMCYWVSSLSEMRPSMVVLSAYFVFTEVSMDAKYAL